MFGVSLVIGDKESSILDVALELMMCVSKMVTTQHDYMLIDESESICLMEKRIHSLR